MRKVYYRYDSSKGVYRRIYPTFKQRIKTYVGRLLSFLLMVCVVFLCVYLFLMPSAPTPYSTDAQGGDNTNYRILSKRVDDALSVLSDIEKRDDNLYRVLLDADPVSKYSRQQNYNGTNRYAELLELDNKDLVMNTAQKIDLLERRLFTQSKSFDELVGIYQDQEERIAHLPSIQPVSNKDLKRTASGYGYRNDPIYHVRKFHQGMDFSCNTGTPIYATGNGKVIYAKWRTGYGNLVEIDHGYGYVTRYAHCSKINVKVGQKVNRGEVIALVGSTGKSTAPHLHYEVIVNGSNVNPVNYYYMDLTVEQFEEMIHLAENQGKVFD